MLDAAAKLAQEAIHCRQSANSLHLFARKRPVLFLVFGPRGHRWCLRRILGGRSRVAKPPVRATHNYHDTYKSFPYGVQAGWGHSWTLYILPFMEQTPLYQVCPTPFNDSGFWGGRDVRSRGLQRLVRTPSPTFKCPSQPGPLTESRNINGLTGRAINNYLGCAGGNARNDNRRRNGMDRSNGIYIARRWDGSRRNRVTAPTKLADVTDGTSSTLLYGEAEYLIDAGKGCNICDRYLYYHMNSDSGGGSDFSEALGSTFYKINTQARNNSERECAFASFHPGGCNGALADGSVRFTAETIDLTIWRGVGSMDVVEVVSGF